MTTKSYRGHNGDVFGVALLDKFLVSAGYDRVIRIFDLETCQLLRVLSGHLDLVRSLTIFRGPTPLIVSGSWDRTICVWNFTTGECLNVIKGHTNRLRAVVVCELTDPGVIISGSDDTTVRSWNIETGEQIAEFNGHAHAILSVAATAEADPLIASGSTDCNIAVWHMQSGTHMYTLEGHTFGVNTLVFAKPVESGRPCLISGSGDSSIRIWDMDTGDVLHVLRDHNFGIVAISMWQESTVPYPYLLACSQNGTLQIWDLRTLVLKKTMKSKTSNLIAIAERPGPDNLVAFGGSEGFLRVQRAEEIYNGSDIIGLPADRKNRVASSSESTSPSGRTKHNKSDSNSLSIEDDTCSINSNTSTLPSIKSPNGIIAREQSKANQRKTKKQINSINNNSNVSIESVFKSKKKEEDKITDSPPGTPHDDEVIYRGLSCDSIETTEGNFENSIDQEKIESPQKNVSNTMNSPKFKKGSGSFYSPSNSSILDNDIDDDSIFEQNSRIDYNNEDGMFAMQSGPILNDNIFTEELPPPIMTVNELNMISGCSFVSTNSDSVSMIDPVSLESVPRIPSGKWKHRGRHGQVKPISKGLGIGGRINELKKLTESIHNRKLPRIIQGAKPFVLVTSVESETYGAATVENHSNRQVRVLHSDPVTIVSSPQTLDGGSSTMSITSHNGYHYFAQSAVSKRKNYTKKDQVSGVVKSQQQQQSQQSQQAPLPPRLKVVSTGIQK